MAFSADQTRNPFEDLGLTKEFVGALLESTPTELGTAIKGLRKVASRAMHPDISGGKPVSNEFYDSFLQATAAIVEMPLDSQKILAKDYVSTKRGRQVKAKIPEFNTADLYSGRILSEIVEMLGQKKQSIPSAQDRRLIFRSDYSSLITTSLRGPLATPVLTVPAEGPLSRQAAQEIPLFPDLNNRESHGKPRDTAIRELSATVWDRIITEIPDGILTKAVREDGIIIEITDHPTQRIYNRSGRVIASTTLPVGLPLTNGFMSLVHMGYPRITHHFELLEDDPQPTDLYVAGTVSREYEEIERTRIFGDQAERNALPSRVGTNHELPLFMVNDAMLRQAEKFYSPHMQLEDRLMVSDKHGILYCLGKIAIIMDASV